ncbi:sgs domain containing protein [Vairimorpha apis BRL 01]|uniref:Sgs domain containing protein n=1 Tax=Vairimorpha apis BRL 01 TaxID=1037528 RepID=T0MD12_9MICR|nr:sgs domain containing protein [Vairimorpha apis BRL 01]
MIEFAESKTKVFLFFYNENITNIELVNEKLLKVDSNHIDLFKEIINIENIIKTKYKTEIVLIKKYPTKWYTLNGPKQSYNKIKFLKHKDDDDVENQECDVLDVLSRIYQNSDDDTRRAMEKSFVESGGKVLSTNWKDVKDKKVEYKETKKELK